jgi:hypothetical protein
MFLDIPTNGLDMERTNYTIVLPSLSHATKILSKTGGLFQPTET